MRTAEERRWWRRYQTHLLSKKWRVFRARIIRIRKCCEKCKSRVRLRVHHLTYVRVGHELESDVQLLCRDCHGKEHPGKRMR